MAFRLAIVASIAVLAATAPQTDCGDGSCQAQPDISLIQKTQAQVLMHAAQAPTTTAPPPPVTAAPAAPATAAPATAAPVPVPAPVPAPVPVAAAPAPVPVYAAPAPPAEHIAAVSTTLKCIIIMLITYFGVYTGLVILNTWQEFQQQKADAPPPSAAIEEMKEAVEDAVKNAPMLSVLFIATRMRAIALVMGAPHSDDPQYYDLPQAWVQTAMYITSLLVVCRVGLVVVTSLVEMRQENSDTSTSTLSKVLENLEFFLLIGISLGFTTVAAGLVSMGRPPALAYMGSMRICDAAICIITITILFFTVAVMTQVATIYDHRTRGAVAHTSPSLLRQNLEASEKDLDYAPMLCILFLMARMRALQMNPNGAPQQWARIFFYVTAFTLVAQFVLRMMEWFHYRGKDEKEISEDTSTFSKILAFSKFICEIAIHVAMVAVVISIFTIKAPPGQVTPPLSTTAQCVIGITSIWVFITAIYFLCDFLKRHQWVSEAVVNVFEAAQASMMFGEMLGVLFIGARMRALQLTNQKGAPQGWVQDCMKLASWAVVLSAFMCITVGLATKKAPGADPRGNKKEEKPDEPKHGRVLGIVCSCFQYFFMFLVYGGAIGIVAGIFQMTPENCRGGQFLPFDLPSPDPQNLQNVKR